MKLGISPYRSEVWFVSAVELVLKFNNLFICFRKWNERRERKEERKRAPAQSLKPPLFRIFMSTLALGWETSLIVKRMD